MDASGGANTSKRRKIDADGGEFEQQSSLVKEAAAESESCSSISSGQSAASSCCSSSGSFEAGTKCVVDLEGESVPAIAVIEDETSTESDRRGPIRGEGGGEKMSKKRAPAAENRTNLRGGSAARMPPEAELEEFFAAAEKQVQQRFTNKYNYDVVNDVPLAGGRYEWIPLKQ
uniref:Cyclin-dependent kinase inhibitor domain-containing protein n=1 Tax=Kalanchoe fedtschenkoi TaxID=63787 RepID=A0A7N0UBP9_KALFE